MTDVESWYYQAMVRDYQQPLLKFLWWNNGRLLEEPQNFVKFAHVFGGTLSASCPNCVFRRTIVENEPLFGKAISEVLQNNFYVDDLLKLLKDVGSAKELVKDAMNMCSIYNPQPSTLNVCIGRKNYSSERL